MSAAGHPHLFAANGRTHTRVPARALAAGNENHVHGAAGDPLDAPANTGPGGGVGSGAQASESGVRGPLIAAPMHLEARLISSAAPGLRVRRTGAGPRHARRAAGELAQAVGEGQLLVLGFGGGLERSGRAGEVVVAEQVLGPGDERLEVHGAEELAAWLRARGLPARRGTAASVPRPALGGQRERLAARGAAVADMESLWLLDGLQEAGGGAGGVLRVIADTPSSGLWRPWRGLRSLIEAARSLRAVAVALEDWTGPGPRII